MVADNVYQEPSISDTRLALDVVQELVYPWPPVLVPIGLAALGGPDGSFGTAYVFGAQPWARPLRRQSAGL